MEGILFEGASVLESIRLLPSSIGVAKGEKSLFSKPL